LVALVDAEEQDGQPLPVHAYEQGTFVGGVQTSRELLEELTDRGHVKLHTSGKGSGTLTVTPEGRRAVKRLREPVPETAVSLGGDQIDRVVRATIECVERSAKEHVTPARVAMRLSGEVDGALLCVCAGPHPTGCCTKVSVPQERRRTRRHGPRSTAAGARGLRNSSLRG
jgi:hypothetical protein